jgi:quercetin dioxygenase-like cupin family protein
MDVTTTTHGPVVLPAEAIEDLPRVPLDPAHPDVSHRVLWQHGSSTAGVMTIGPGARLGRHAHRLNQHHIWVIDGQVEILGAVVGPGAYVHVPSGLEHDMAARSPTGCTVFYLYVRPG